MRHLLSLLLLVLFAGPAAAQSSPEEVILRAAQASELTQQALEDVVDPIGGLLGRISPSSSYGTANRGFGYFALSFGATGLQFNITDPDYTQVTAGESAGEITGPAGAIFADAEIGLFSGYGRTSKLKNVGSVDLLVRLGATLGDQDDLGNELDLGSLAPIYGLGARIGLIRGDDLPSVSLSAGTNHFAKRRFAVQGEFEGDPFVVALDFKQSSSFLLLEVGKQWRGFLPFLGGGGVWHRLKSDVAAEIVYETNNGTERTVTSEGFAVDGNHGVFFGGLELGVGIFRVVMEGGVSSGSPYGSFFLKFIPFPGWDR